MNRKNASQNGSEFLNFVAHWRIQWSDLNVVVAVWAVATITVAIFSHLL